jgi:DNA repair exonuclease SbcCD nuclease subunit
LIKLLCIGDLHLKIHADVPLAWQLDRYRQLFTWVVAQCREQKARLILAGDQFDSTRPKKEEIQLFLELLHRLEVAEIETFLVSGNHETLAEGSSILDYFELSRFPNLHYRANMLLPHETGHVLATLINHDSLSAPRPVDQAHFLDEFTLLVSHFRSDYNKWVKEEIDVAALADGYDLVIAGDIHDSFQFDNVWYTNNPLNKDFEANPHCGCLWVEIDPQAKSYKAWHEKLEFPALRKVACSVKEWPCALPEKDYCQVEVSGAPEALRMLAPAEGLARVVPIPQVGETLSLEGAEASETEVGLCEGLTTYVEELSENPEETTEMMTFFQEELAV